MGNLADHRRISCMQHRSNSSFRLVCLWPFLSRLERKEPPEAARHRDTRLWGWTWRSGELREFQLQRLATQQPNRVIYAG